MRFPLWLRLFVAFAMLSFAGLAALTIAQKLTFQRDFLAYLNEGAKARVARAAVELGKRYERNQDWSFVIGRGRVFDTILRGDGDPGRVGELQPSEGGPPRGEPGPGRRPREEFKGRAPPDDFRVEPRKGGGPRDAPPTKRISALDLATRVALLTSEGRFVIGNPAVPLDSPSVPVISQGVEVGRLLVAPQPALEGDFDLAFVRSQTQHAWAAAAGVLVAASLVAWLLARWLLAPVNVLNARMKTLAAGDFSERIETSRRDELGDLSRNYNRLAETLAKSQEERRAWGADIAHELRTPLSILRGEIQALEDGVRPLTREAMGSLQSECMRLTSLVEDLYLLALSDAGALEYRFANDDVNELVRETEREFSRVLSAAGLKPVFSYAPEPLVVRIDARRLVQLIANLVTNSSRYTDSPGEVRIRTTRVGANAVFTIEDSLPGVPKEMMNRLFDRLFRVEGSRNRAAGGAGLGLSICRNIAQAHQGTLTASASILGGLCMTLSLPLVTDRADARV